MTAPTAGPFAAPPPGLPEPNALEFRAVDRANWSELEALFDAPGGPKHCWCMVWRATAEERRNRAPASKKEALRSRVESGVPVGIVGLRDGRPVAWCSIAPRATYRAMGGVDLPDEDPERIWAIVCFYVARAERGRHMTRRLIEAAVEHAARAGATAVEAYPVDPDAPSYRFMGFVPTFLAAGFVELARAGTRRHVMRRAV